MAIEVYLEPVCMAKWTLGIVLHYLLLDGFFYNCGHISYYGQYSLFLFR